MNKPMIIIRNRLLFVTLVTITVSLIVYHFIPAPYNALCMFTGYLGGLKFRSILEDYS